MSRLALVERASVNLAADVVVLRTHSLISAFRLGMIGDDYKPHGHNNPDNSDHCCNMQHPADESHGILGIVASFARQSQDRR